MGVSGEPDRFPANLLTQPAGARQEYFEQQWLREHPHLQKVFDHLVPTIGPPGEGASRRRPGTMALVIGPSRGGKTTLIRLLQERLLAQAKSQRERAAGCIPFARMTAAGPNASRVDGRSYSRAILRGRQDPCVDGKMARIRARELREAMETAWLQRKSIALMLDEAHHLATTSSGRSLQDQLKYFENLTGGSHLLVGPYELRPFRKINAHLACRSVDRHFPRYDAAIDWEAQVFRRVLWALQPQLPVEQEPQLVEHCEFW